MDVSIIMPAYNSEKTIDLCLKSIFNSSYKNFKVIVVDDGSTDSTSEKAKKYRCKIIKLKKNRGVAYARNIGARNAKSNLLVFIDSDVIVRKNTLLKLVTAYKSNPTIKIVCATQSGKYLSNNFGAKFITLKVFYDYKWEKNEKIREHSAITTDCCLIEKKVFDEIKGFNMGYKGAGMEEFEFSYRLNKKGYLKYIYRDILYDHKVSLRKRVNALFRRASLYLPLFLKKKSFETDGATGTKNESFISLSYFLGLITILLAFISIKLLIIPLLFFIIIFTAKLNFFLYLMRKQGILFSLISFFALIYLHLAISFGVFLGIIKMFNNKIVMG